MALIERHFFFCIGILIDHTWRNCLWYGLTRFRNSVSPKQLTSFLFSRSQSKFSTGFELFSYKSLILFHEVESCWIRNAKKCHKASHGWIFRLIFLLCSMCFVFLSMSQLIVSLTWVAYLFLGIMEKILYIAVELLIGR